MSRPSSAPVRPRFWMTEREQDLLDQGVSPVEFLINTFRDETMGAEVRMDAAKSLMPYVARRAPQAVELSGPNGDDITFREKSAIRSKLANLLGVED